jgi:hypothetical protein
MQQLIILTTQMLAVEIFYDTRAKCKLTRARYELFGGSLCGRIAVHNFIVFRRNLREICPFSRDKRHATSLRLFVRYS